MGTVREQKKQEKRQSLLDASYSLFLEKGVMKTTVDEIVRRANVAKGTFYLYFSDKGDLMQALVGRICYHVLSEAGGQVRAASRGNPVDDAIALVDYVIEYFKKDKLTLKLLERNFSWPLFAATLKEQREDPLWKSFAQSMQENGRTEGRTQDEQFERIYALVGMCGSVCYSSIIRGEPDSIDNMKPVLYEIIRRALA